MIELHNFQLGNSKGDSDSSSRLGNAHLRITAEAWWVGYILPQFYAD
jgi:hypothetical protein